MSNEYLKRTPTSTGNRKIFTYAGWFKKNYGNGSTRFDIFNAHASGSQQEEIGFRQDALRYLSAGSSLYGFDTTNKYRDTGSWFHVVFALNTTLESERKRSVVYINGVEVDTTTSSGIGAYVAKNFNSIAFNVVGKEHNVLARKYSSSSRDYPEGGGFDIFFVDGQALTPDVFGFFKDGKGYQSSGTTKVTDFRPGQWSPHSPRKIKTEIERKGGFGVNGFYLPMNDSSNFGADFHCTPNSIIKLKGEDLPQPRNGLPTTSDNYVSQLREDPYAANLVLAVPGVNTQPTGSELITNGTFDTNVSGWTITDTGTIVRQSDGTAKVTRGSSAQVVYQDITTVVGTTYELSVDITDIAGSHGQVYVKSTDHSGSLDTNIGYSFYPGTFKGTFTADTTTTRIILYAHPSGSTSYDNVSVKATTIPDYSADIKGSGTNKTITPYADASVRNPHQRNGRHVNGYYGSALSLDGTGDVLKTASHADFNLGNGDYTIEGWYYDQETAINTGSRCYWAIGGVNSEGTLALFRESSYLMLRGRSPGAGAYSNIIYVNNHNIPVGQWNHICTERFNGVTTVYINGVPLYPTEETTTVSQGYFTIGAFSSGGSYPYYGYIQDVRVYKGVAKYKGGFDVAKPYAPENSDTNKGIQTWRQVSDTCKNNFCTLNGLDTSQITPFNGSSSVDQSSGGWHSLLGTHYARSGKWYAEMRIDRLGWIFFGVEQTWLETRTRHIGGQTGSKGAGLVYNTGNRGDITYNGSNNAYTGGDATAANGDIISVALDLDNNNVKFYKNNVLQYNLNNILESGADYTFGLGLYSDVAATVNFGQNPTFSGKIRAGTNTDDSGKGVFKYAPPSGFLALCDDNLPTPTIADPGKQFKAVTYTADDSSSMKISGVGFKPDLIWFKKRTGGSQNHTLFDSIRGVRRRLYPNTSAGEGTVTGYLSSFDENGFSIGGNNFVNDSGQDYVAWCWKAGGAAVANTDGSINSQVSVNQTAGFSIVTYTGTASNVTVGHGLGKKPSFILLKERYSPGNSYSNWQVYHSSLGATQRLQLSLSDAADTASNIWNDTEPTSDVFSIGTSGAMSENGGTYVAYCWAEIEGFSKFGKYIGNGNSDGPFVYLGFKPAWVLIKRTTTDGYYWTLFDNARKPTNPVNHTLNPDQVNAEITDGGNGQIDFLSNGFKCRNTDGGINSDDVTYIYMAFAESPFQTANAK